MSLELDIDIASIEVKNDAIGEPVDSFYFEFKTDNPININAFLLAKSEE